MPIIILLIIVLIVLALAIYLVELLPIPNTSIKRIIEALCVLAAIVFICDRAGLLR